MLPFPHPPFGRGIKLATRRVGDGAAVAAGAVTLPASARPFDLLVATRTDRSLSGGDGGGVWVNVGSTLKYRRLTAEDLAPGVFNTNTGSGPVAWTVLSGVFDIVFKSSSSGIGNSPMAGFTKASNCAGLLATSRNPWTGSPPGMAAPWSSNRILVGGVGIGICLCDLTDPSLYANGSTVHVSSSTGFESVSTSSLYEMRF